MHIVSVSEKTPDLVWLVRPGENEELRHSIRSITKNLPHGNVWAIGKPPSWFTGGVIRTKGTRYNTNDRFLAVQRSLRLACEDRRVSDPFIACDDDVYLRRPLSGLPACHRGRLLDFHTAPPYDTRAHDTAHMLQNVGVRDPLNYDLHMPITVHKAPMIRALEMAAKAPADIWVWSLYANLANLGGDPVCDPKAYGTHLTRIEHEPGHDDPGPWLSTDDRSWEGAAGALIRAEFPDPCDLEDPSATITRLSVLSINAGADTGGVSWGMYEAFKGDALIDLRSAILSTNYIRYPHDLPFSYPAIYGPWNASDIVHLHNNMRSYDVFVKRGQFPKPFLLHHHGTEFREQHAAMNREVADLGGRALVSTVDMLDLGTKLAWIPASYQMEPLAAMRHPIPGKKLRIGHAPTDRSIKSTDAFIKACKTLDVTPVIIEKRSWADCLKIKATCDILFDQVQLGYGCNAIEAMGMGIPVIAGASPRTLEIMRGIFGRLPFRLADESSIGDAIRALMDETTRAEWAGRGRDHALRYHSGVYARAVLKYMYLDMVQTNEALRKFRPLVGG